LYINYVRRVNSGKTKKYFFGQLRVPGVIFICHAAFRALFLLILKPYFIRTQHIMKLRTKLSILVTTILVVSFGITFYRTSSFQNELMIRQAERQARMLARQILLTRKWVADHDGLFFIKKPGVESNPFLSESAIKDVDGKVYVKRNPAMVTRELSDYASQADFCRFRVTSLKPVNPDNAPDEFERAGLFSFEKGQKEIVSIVAGDSGRLLRYMVPLSVEESCLACHAEHGYQIGDARGALSLEIPVSWADKAISANNRLLMAIGFITIMATALTIFLLINFLVVRRLDRLSIAMDSFPDKDLAESDLPVGSDEVGTLAANFADLARRLVSSQSELEQAREQMYQQEKMAAIGQLAAGIAHEVNNPLGGMSNCVKSMRENPDNQEMRRRYLELLDKGLSRIGHIVRQLLNFGRKDPLCLREINVDEIIRDCFDLLAYQLKNIELIFDLHINCPWPLDAEALKQTLVNIGLNGAQAMPDGGTLTITSRETTTEIILTIQDNGPGIDKDDLPHIFEPFFTTKETGKGTGLGLSVSFSLINRMAGSIRVESEIDRGSTFIISLPKKPVAAAGQEDCREGLEQ